MQIRCLITLMSLGGAVAPAHAEPQAPSLPVYAVYRITQQGGGLGRFVDEAVIVSAVGAGPARIWVAEPDVGIRP